MALSDILLHIDSYPEPTPPAAIDQAVQLAGWLGGRLTALAVQVDIPLKSNRLADYLIGLSRMAQEEESKSRRNCRESLDHFTEKATAAGVFEGVLLERANLYELSELVARRARTRDLCIVPLGGRFDGQEEVAQSVIFGSGRPVLVYRTEPAAADATGLDVVAVAWDGSRCAARAMADALPILARAKAVRVLTVVNEKPAAVAELGAEAVRRLKMHGIAAVAETVDAAGEAIGKVLDTYLKREAVDLLVMGAYGHSRVREFILGGATEYMLTDPVTPVFMSH
jgi:nucleotide-binding universal stress UspA family protein